MGQEVKERSSVHSKKQLSDNNPEHVEQLRTMRQETFGPQRVSVVRDDCDMSNQSDIPEADEEK